MVLTTVGRSGRLGWSMSINSTMLALRSRPQAASQIEWACARTRSWFTEFEPWRGDRSGDHVLAAREVVGVVGVAGGTVGQHHCGLAGPARAPGSLGVVGRRRGHIAHADHVEAADIHTQFHGGRAIQHRELGVTEEVFALLAYCCFNLSGMFARFEADECLGGLGVELFEERIDAALCLVAADRIGFAAFSWRRAPFDETALDLVSGALVGADDLRQDAGVVHHGEQVGDDCIGIGGFERLAVQRKTLGLTQPASVETEPGNK